VSATSDEVLSEIREMRRAMDARHTEMLVRFGEVERRFNTVDESFTKVETRLGVIEERVAGVEKRLGFVEADFKGLRSDLLRHRHDEVSGRVVIDPPE
jgi:hypothetical protein